MQLCKTNLNDREYRHFKMRFNILYTILLLTASVLADDVSQYQYRSMAESKDFNFFMAFLNDFDKNFPVYTSYMVANKLRLPQQVADYYNHLAKLPSTVNLEDDIINSFPYTEFQTFVTNFPWYTSLLKEGDITTMYLPRDFESISVNPGKTTATATATADKSSNGTISGTGSASTTEISSTKTSSTKTKKTKNGATNMISLSTPLYILAAALGMLL